MKKVNNIKRGTSLLVATALAFALTGCCDEKHEEKIQSLETQVAQLKNDKNTLEEDKKNLENKILELTATPEPTVAPETNYVEYVKDYKVKEISEEDGKKIAKLKETYEYAGPVISLGNEKYICVSPITGKEGLVAYDDLHVVLEPGKYLINCYYILGNEVICNVYEPDFSDPGYISLTEEKPIIDAGVYICGDPIKINDTYICKVSTRDFAYHGIYDLSNKKELLPIKYNSLSIVGNIASVNENSVEYDIDLNNYINGKKLVK